MVTMAITNKAPMVKALLVLNILGSISRPLVTGFFLFSITEIKYIPITQSKNTMVILSINGIS